MDPERVQRLKMTLKNAVMQQVLCNRRLNKFHRITRILRTAVMQGEQARTAIKNHAEELKYMSLAERLDNAEKYVRKISAPRFQEIESKVESFTNS